MEHKPTNNNKNMNPKTNTNQNTKENPEMATVEAIRDDVAQDELITGTIKVSTKGQIVIPKAVREAAGIKEGEQRLNYRFVDGMIILEKEEYLTPEELFGILNREEDEGNFVLDIQAAREERVEEILNKRWL